MAKPTSPDASQDSSLAFSAFRLEPDGSFFRGETPIHLQPRELGALRLLIANAGQIVTPQQFKQTLWGDTHVTADSIPRCLSSLRARLQPDDCIQTVYKRGYRLIAEVRRLSASVARGVPRLAIPPFATDTAIPEHLGAAIAEETIFRLGNSPQPIAFLLARDSVFSLARSGRTALQVGETLGADLVLAGTLRALVSHFRLRVEMIRVSDGVQIWVEDLLVDRERTQGLEIRLAQILEARLKTLTLGSRQGTAMDPATHFSGHPSLAAASPPDTLNSPSLSISAAEETSGEPESGSRRHEAYSAFQRGHHEWQSLERHRMQDGLQHLSRAIELDPSLIAAKIDLANLCITQSFYGFMAPAVCADLVHRTVDSIPELLRLAARILPALAWVNFHFDRNLSAAMWAFQLSSGLPHDPWITRVRAIFSLSRGRYADAIAILRESLALDPYSPWLNTRLAWALHLAGQPAESLAQVEHSLRLFPEHEGSTLYGSMLLAWNGDHERAIQLAESLARSQPYFDLATTTHAYALACAGRHAEAHAILERLQWLTRERFVLRSFNAAVYLALGDTQTAIQELDAANQVRCPWFFMALNDPRLNALHGNPRFQELQSILPRMEMAVRSEGLPQGS